MGLERSRSSVARAAGGTAGLVDWSWSTARFNWCSSLVGSRRAAAANWAIASPGFFSRSASSAATAWYAAIFPAELFRSSRVCEASG